MFEPRRTGAIPRTGRQRIEKTPCRRFAIYRTRQRGGDGRCRRKRRNHRLRHLGTYRICRRALGRRYHTVPAPKTLHGDHAPRKTYLETHRQRTEHFGTVQHTVPRQRKCHQGHRVQLTRVSQFPVHQQGTENKFHRSGYTHHAGTARREAPSYAFRHRLRRDQSFAILLLPTTKGRSRTGCRYGIYGRSRLFGQRYRLRHTQSNDFGRTAHSRQGQRNPALDRYGQTKNRYARRCGKIT